MYDYIFRFGLGQAILRPVSESTGNVLSTVTGPGNWSVPVTVGDLPLPHFVPACSKLSWARRIRKWVIINAVY